MLLSDNADTDREDDAIADYMHIEPIFWGTSEVLEFNSDTCIATAFSQLQVLASQDPVLHEYLQNENAIETVKKTLHEILTPRALYGFFPTITEQAALVVLDPSNFCSELLSFKTDGLPDEFKKFIAQCNPDGDVVSFGGISLCADVKRMYAVITETANSKTTQHLGTRILRALHATIEKRIAAEIQRGIGGNNFGALLFPLDCLLSDSFLARHLFEMMGFEERLNISIDQTGLHLPETATVFAFFHG